MTFIVLSSGEIAEISLSVMVFTETLVLSTFSTRAINVSSSKRATINVPRLGPLLWLSRMSKADTIKIPSGVEKKPDVLFFVGSINKPFLLTAFIKLAGIGQGFSVT